MEAERLIKECCDYSFSRVSNTDNDKDLMNLMNFLDEIEKHLPEELFIKLDNLIGLANSSFLLEGYKQGFKDGSNLIMYLSKEK